MKKVWMFLIMFFFMLPVTHAATLNDISNCEQSSSDPTLQVCTFAFRADGEITYNMNRLVLTLTNVTLKEIELGDDWYYEQTGENEYTFQTSKDTLTGDVLMARITFQKIEAAEDCHIRYQCNWQKIDRTCTIYQGNYYGLNGRIVDALTYQKECEKPACFKYSDGTFSGPDGSIISELEYQKQCEKPACYEYSDGTFSGPDGNLISELEYEKQCKTHKCEILSDGTRYGINGNIVDAITYQKECEKPACYEYSDGTFSGPDGNLISVLEYEKQCKEHKCEILSDGTRYGITRVLYLID